MSWVFRRSSMKAHHVDPSSRWATAVGEHSSCHFCLQRTANNMQGLAKIGQKRDACFDESAISDLQIVESGFGLNCMQSSSCYQWWWWHNDMWDIFSHILGPLIELNIVEGMLILLLTKSVPSWPSVVDFQWDNTPSYKVQIISKGPLEHNDKL